MNAQHLSSDILALDGSKISLLCRQQNPRMNQKRLAAKAGLSQAFISRIVGNKVNASRDVADRIAAALGVTTEDITFAEVQLGRTERDLLLEILARLEGIEKEMRRLNREA